ncbi:MAG: helix-turn-helix transcriptional regulator [Nevskia sp.]|nr:helix-turn-helix transcriptional regulator [Nevskia sp.]
MPASAKTRQSRKAQTPIPKRIREVRTALGLSQSELGHALKLDRDVAIQRVSQYELGTHTPVYSLIQRLAAFTKIPESYFYTTDDELAQLIADFGRLNQAARRKLLKVSAELRDESVT